MSDNVCKVVLETVSGECVQSDETYNLFSPATHILTLSGNHFTRQRHPSSFSKPTAPWSCTWHHMCDVTVCQARHGYVIVIKHFIVEIKKKVVMDFFCLGVIVWICWSWCSFTIVLMWMMYPI